MLCANDGFARSIDPLEKEYSYKKGNCKEARMTDAALPAMHILDASDNQSEMSVMHHPTASVTSESETTNSTDCCLELTSSDFNQDGTDVDLAVSMQELTANLFEFQQSGYLCDTVIIADDGQLTAHIVVLAAVSPVFRRVLKSTDKPLQHVILMPGMQIVIVNIIIQFVYTGKITVARDGFGNSAKVMDAIDELGIKLHVESGADENVDGPRRLAESPDHSYLSDNAEKGQTSVQEEMTTTDGAGSNAASSADCYEDANHDSPSDHTALHGHKFNVQNYSVVFSRHAPKGPVVCHLCSKVFCNRNALRKHVQRIHDRKAAAAAAANQPTFPLCATNAAVANSDDGKQKSDNNRNAVHKDQLSSGLGDEQSTYALLSDADTAVAKRHNGKQKENETSEDDNTTVCNICGWVSTKSTSMSLSTHMRVHNVEKRFKCSQCSSSFALAPNLRRHEILHADVRRFLCQYCAESFQQNASLQRHIFKLHPDKVDSNPSSRPFGCQRCGERFYRSSHVRLHMKREHQLFSSYVGKRDSTGLRAYGCSVCDTSYTSSSYLNQHVMTHWTDNIESVYKCQVCNDRFDLMTALECHVSDLHSVNLTKYHCSECGKSFSTEVKLKMHRCVRTADAIACELCFKKFAYQSALDQHMDSHTVDSQKSFGDSDVTAFGCSVCNTSYTSTVRLNEHIMTHWTDNIGSVYKCQLCSEQFELMTALESHVSGIHSVGQLHYRCSDCEKSFGTEIKLKLHKRVHTDDALLCTVCSKTFVLPSELKYHMDFHAGEKRFGCSICGKRFSIRQSMLSHELIHSGDKPFLCKTCGKAFRQKNHLIQHWRVHTNTKPYRCSVCSKAYKRRVDLRYHCTRVHDLNLPVTRHKTV